MGACAVDRGRAGGRDAEATLKVLVHYEPCASGRRALAHGLELTDPAGELTVVTLAQQAGRSCCSRGGTAEYNCAVRDEARLELNEAREMTGPAAMRTSFATLVERRDPPLAIWAAQRGFDVVLLAEHRLTRGGNILARKLRRATSADVRVVA
jgi:hypothetical protein